MIGGRMRIRRLQFVIHASEHGSFRKAASVLNVQQSVVSRQIRELEDELGVSLFHRTPNGVTLTNAGQAYIDQVRIGLDQLNQAAIKAAAAGRAETGLVRIGLYSSLASGFLHDLLDDYAGQHPTVSLDLVEADLTELAARVRKQELDIAFVAQEHQFHDCETQALWAERLLLCVSEQSPLALLEEVDWTAMRLERFLVRTRGSGPQILGELTKLFAEFSYPLDVESQDVSREMLMDLVRIGKGATFANEASLGSPFPGVTMIPIKDYILDFYAVWKAENDNPAFRRFLALARKMSKQRLPARQ